MLGARPPHPYPPNIEKMPRWARFRCSVLPHPPNIETVPIWTRFRCSAHVHHIPTFHQPPCPSLTFRARRRGSSPSNNPLPPLPHSKSEAEGGFCHPTHHPPPSLEKRDGGGLSPSNPPHPPPRLKCEMEGVIPLHLLAPTHPHPLLSRRPSSFNPRTPPSRFAASNCPSRPCFSCVLNFT